MAQDVGKYRMWSEFTRVETQVFGCDINSRGGLGIISSVYAGNKTCTIFVGSERMGVGGIHIMLSPTIIPASIICYNL